MRLGEASLLLDYLVIGHVTRDVVDSCFTLGGTAAYAARTARALGARVGVVTSIGPGLDLRASLKGVLVDETLAPRSTTFENSYAEGRRLQRVRSRAWPLGPGAVPRHWRARLVHVGPVAQECDPALVRYFEGSFVGVTPQGWMRRWGRTGRVQRCRWSRASDILPDADAVVLSEEDVGGDRTLASEYAEMTQYLALTEGAAGCTVYAGDEVCHFSAPRVREVDPTGAGDVFAACFFYALSQGEGVWDAARFANCLAAQSVTRSGLHGTPGRRDVIRCRRATLGDERDDAHCLRTG